MARDKKKPTSSAGSDANGATTPSLTSAIIHALNTLGVDAKTADVKSHIQSHFPGVDVEAASLPSTLSIKRKAMREGRSGRASKSTNPSKPATGKPRGRPKGSMTKTKRVAVVHASEPTL